MGKRQFITEDGTILELNRLSPAAIQLLEYRAKKNRPKPPTVSVPIPGRPDQFRQESNPNDPMFLQQMADWEDAKNEEMMRYVYTVGVANPVPDDFAQQHRDFFGSETTETDLKFMWVGSFLNSESEGERFMNAALGQTMITPEGVKDSEDRFSGGGEQTTDRELQLQEPPTSPDSV